MKIAITGATGQLGQLVVSKLKNQGAGENIVALVRSRQKASGLGVEIREANYDDAETLESALSGIDTLLLISGSEVGKRAVQHRNIIDAAKKNDVKWIVYTSLLHADTSTLSLAAEHLATEAALRDSGIPYTLLRNGWYTENYTGSIPGALAGGAFIGSVGEGKIASAARADYADAAVAVLTTEGHEAKIYELAGDQAWTLSDLAAEISRQSGKNIPYVNMPEAEYANALKGFGLPEGLSHAIAGWDVSASRGDLFDDGRELSRLIGHQTTPLSEVVAAALK
ncbi:NAD(P)H dehydrogenase (quinone) [Arcticibacter pallidicorallinus]|uniref:NAD(P)H dehydrogenase (Quinone) n=1 Tax=Arcticibacter pallidicorallinus TaxID=1259464 RepID=A0A2T0UBC5_9SPHI|nr:SDR family oxidoreductase [Arcticibacter pallidicorallinus]PRY55219.1 NAD(P)H dehydrogenase (quinone) [Arcticibacter pallidicorallinus]